MKKKVYLLAALLLACTIAIGCNTKTAEAKRFETTGYSFTDSTITVKWASPYDNGDVNPSYYEIVKYALYDYETGTYIKSKISPTATSCKITELKKGYVGRWRIDYTLRSISTGSEYDYTYDYLYVNTTPSKVKKSQFCVSYASLSSKKCNFEVAKDSDMTGYQLKVYKGTSLVKTFKTKSRYTDYLGIYLNKVYKFKVRQYYTNTDTQKTYYGAWSDYRYFDCANITGSYKYDVKGVNLKFKKVTNVKNYVIYVAKGSSSNTYKKTQTVTVTDSTYKTIRLSKYGDNTMKKGTSYYIKIIPMIKAGSSTVKSDVVFTTSYYCSH